MHVGLTSGKEHQQVTCCMLKLGVRDLPRVLCLVFGRQGNCCSGFSDWWALFLRSAVKLNAVAEVGTLRFKMLLFSVCSYTRKSWNRRGRPWDGGTWCFCPLYLIQSLFIPTHSILTPFHPTLSHQIQSIPQWSLGENMMRDQHFHMLETQLTHSFLAREKHQVSFLHSDHILTQLAPCLEQTLRFQDELVPVTGFHLDPAGAAPWTFAVHSFDCCFFLQGVL